MSHHQIRPAIRLLREPEPIEAPPVKIHRPTEQYLTGYLEVDATAGIPILLIRAACPTCSTDHPYEWPPELGNDDEIAAPAACPGERGRDVTHRVRLDPDNALRDFGTHRKYLRLIKAQSRRRRDASTTQAS